MSADPFQPSLCRQALDLLLAAHPHLDLVSVSWQLGMTRWEPAVKASEPKHEGPWLLVELGQPSDHWAEVPAWAVWSFAIWKTTGAIHTMSQGAVSDEPILEVAHEPA